MGQPNTQRQDAGHDWIHRARQEQGHTVPFLQNHYYQVEANRRSHTNAPTKITQMSVTKQTNHIQPTYQHGVTQSLPSTN